MQGWFSDTLCCWESRKFQIIEQEIIVLGQLFQRLYRSIHQKKTAEAFFEFESASHWGSLRNHDRWGAFSMVDAWISRFNGYRIELEDVSQNLNKSRFIESAVLVHVITRTTRYKIYWPMWSKDGVRQQFERDQWYYQAIGRLDWYHDVHMMPSKFLWSGQLPLTPNGKIDVKADQWGKQSMMEFFKQFPHLEPYGNPQYFLYIIGALYLSLSVFFRNVCLIWGLVSLFFIRHHVGWWKNQISALILYVIIMKYFLYLSTKRYRKQQDSKWIFYLVSFLSLLPIVLYWKYLLLFMDLNLVGF